MKNLNYCLERVKLNLSIVGTQHDQQLLQWLIDGYQKLNELEIVSASVKVAELPIVNHKATLPRDYQDYLRIGVCVNGRFINFDKNDSLCLPMDNKNECPCSGEEIQDFITGCCNTNPASAGTVDGNIGLGSVAGWWFPTYGQPYSYSYSMGSYAIGPGFYHGGYKIDLHSQQILFDQCVCIDHCVLEYFGDFMNDMGNAYVPENMVQCLINYVNWQRAIWSPDAMVQRQTQANHSRWYQSVRDIVSKQQKMTKNEWVDLIREYTYQGVKA